MVNGVGVGLKIFLKELDIDFARFGIQFRGFEQFGMRVQQEQVV